MKICPKCEIEHDRPGKFCSRKCANSRTYTPELKERRRIDQKKHMATPQGQQQLERIKIGVSDGFEKYREEKYYDPDDEPLGIVDFDDDYNPEWH